jgi:AcrR family transcriptional regulator
MTSPDVRGTRAKLTAAAADALRENGIAELSARSVAGRADVNQALIFYHFGSVADLIDAACREAVDSSIDGYRQQFAAVGSFVELLTLGRDLHERERATGNVAIMAQLMAGAQSNERLAATARYCLARWNAELETVVARLVDGSAFEGLLEPAGFARAISSGFLGLELYEGVDSAGAHDALEALERLGVLVEVVDELPPIAQRALRAKLRRRTRS